MTLKSPARSRIPLSQPSISEEDIAAVLSVLRTPTLSLGPKVKSFENAVAAYSGAKHAVAVNSGTSGLHICLAAAEVGEGHEVITSPFSFVASANCAIFQNATPVFVDIDPDTLNIDPSQVEVKVTDRTKAIVPVDVFGQPANIEAIAEAHNLTIVQDACEAIGAERNGKRVGGAGIAKAAVFAFYPNKQMTTGEGGIVVTDDEPFANILRSLANQGRDDAGTWMNHVRLGYNYRLDEMSAALGLSQISRLDDILARRSQVAAWDGERLQGIDGVVVPYVAPETTRMSWFVYVIRVAPNINRVALIPRLQADGVPVRPSFVPIHLQPYYRERFGYKEGDFPVTEAVAKTTLAIPFFTDMTESQVDYVCAHIDRRL